MGYREHVSGLGARLALSLELARLLQLLVAEDAERVYSDLVVDYPHLPTWNELELTWGFDDRQIGFFDQSNDGEPFPEERF